MQLSFIIDSFVRDRYLYSTSYESIYAHLRLHRIDIAEHRHLPYFLFSINNSFACSKRSFLFQRSLFLVQVQRRSMNFSTFDLSVVLIVFTAMRIYKRSIKQCNVSGERL